VASPSLSILKRPAAAISVVLALSLAAPAGAAGPVPLSNAAPYVAEMGRLLADQSVPVADRIEIIKALDTFGSEETREPLVAALQDPAPEIRDRAASALARPGDGQAAAALLRVVERPGETAAVRASALWSLGVIGDDSTRPAVIAATRDPDPGVRRSALRSVTLGALARPADRSQYLVQLTADRAVDLQVRAEAVQAMGEVNEPEIVDALIRLLETETPIPMPMPRPGATQQEIMMVRYRQARDVRAWAANSLGKLDARRALPQILASAEAPDDFFLRQISLMTLLSWQVREVIPVLVRRLDDPFAEIRWLALTGIARLGDKTLVDPVLARLSDKVGTVRAQAVLTLGELGDRRVRERLEKLRDTDIDPEVQQALEKALPLLGS
jgi:HEAT repeat protein